MMTSFPICDYGCEQDAKFQMPSGKWCCERFYTKCPAIKKKTASVGEKNGMFGKYHKIESKEKIQNRINSFIPFNNKKNILCQFGCDQEAKYILYSKKYCCSNYHSKCQNQKNLNRKGNKTTIQECQEKHPKFFKEEKIREINGNIEVQCKFCNTWFSPKYEQIRSRMGYIEKKIGQRNSYLFCSADCKFKSLDYHKCKRKDPVKIENFKTYSEEVWRLTRITVNKHRKTIKDLQLRGRKFKKHLDHKVSIYDGFINNIDPKIVSNINNLEIIDEYANCKKHIGSSLSIQNLICLINVQENSDD